MTGAEIGKRIRAARITQGLTQDELAELTGVTQSAIGRYEKGLTPNPGWAHIARLARGLGIDPRDLESDLEFTRPDRPLSPVEKIAILEEELAALRIQAAEFGRTARDALALAQQIQRRLGRDHSDEAAS